MKEKHWYVIYTRSRAEKKVSAELEKRGIESYLPLEKTIRQWSDRKKKVKVPLFSCYVFVHIPWSDYLKVLQTPYVAGFVRFNKAPAIVSEQQIKSIHIITEGMVPVEKTTKDFQTGETITITYGNLKGLQGILIEKKGKKKLLIQIESINQNLLVDIHPAYVKKINPQKKQ